MRQIHPQQSRIFQIFRGGPPLTGRAPQGEVGKEGRAQETRMGRVGTRGCPKFVEHYPPTENTGSATGHASNKRALSAFCQQCTSFNNGLHVQTVGYQPTACFAALYLGGALVTNIMILTCWQYLLYFACSAVIEHCDIVYVEKRILTTMLLLHRVWYD